jgi:hypothetical protein
MAGWIVAAWILFLNPLSLIFWIASAMTLKQEIDLRRERKRAGK